MQRKEISDKIETLLQQVIEVYSPSVLIKSLISIVDLTRIKAEPATIINTFEVISTII